MFYHANGNKFMKYELLQSVELLLFVRDQCFLDFTLTNELSSP